MRVDVEDARVRLLEWLEAAAQSEDVRIAATEIEGQTMVRLVTVRPQLRLPQFGSARGRLSMAADFDPPVPDFAD